MLLEALFSNVHEGFATIWAKRGSENGTRWYDLSQDNQIAAMYSDAAKLDAQGYDVYFSTCPSEKRGSSNARIKQDDVLCIPALFVDIDTKLDQAKASKNVPDDIKSAMAALYKMECPPTMTVASGHGIHAYWILNNPIDTRAAEDKKSAKSILRNFAEAVKIATGYSDLDAHASEPSRVLRVDGTHNHKYGEVLPVEWVPGESAPIYELSDLVAFAEQYTPDEPPVHYVDVVAREVQRQSGKLTDEEIMSKAPHARDGFKFQDLWAGNISNYKSHSEADQALCNILAFWTNDDADQMDRLFRQSGLMRDKWDRPQSGSTYGAITIQEAITSPHKVYDRNEYVKRELGKVKIGKGDHEKNLVDLHPNTNRRYSWSDIGNGYLFADWYKDVARYVPERKKWFVYDGKRWMPDPDNLRAMELCKKLADQLVLYALSIEDEKQRQDYLKFVNGWQKRTRRETILKDASGVYPVSIHEFDVDPHVFNCQNGTLNLRDETFHPHDPADMLSKIANVDYEPKARSERWERFIREVMEDEAEKAEFFQKAIGYTLTGDTSYECFFLLYIEVYAAHGT